MADLKGTQTEKNLLTAFSGESQARNRYTYFASQAKKEGYVQISDIFTETANQEKEHAKRLFKLLQGGEVEITGAFPAGTIAATMENLQEAAAGENYEYTEMYPGFAKIATEEGFGDIADISPPLRLLKSSMKNGIWNWPPILMPAGYSKKMRRWFGDASTADTFMRAAKRPRIARHVTIPRLILSYWVKTGRTTQLK